MAKQLKVPKAKHVPQRMCVACRRTDAKRGLVRIVRLPDGHVTVDPTGKKAGRGAYICNEHACWDAAIKRRALERSLNIEQLLPDDQQALAAYAATLERSTSTTHNHEPVIP